MDFPETNHTQLYFNCVYSTIELQQLASVVNTEIFYPRLESELILESDGVLLHFAVSTLRYTHIQQRNYEPIGSAPALWRKVPQPIAQTLLLRLSIYRSGLPRLISQYVYLL